METTPRASTWTAEDTGTQLHSKDDETHQHAAQRICFSRQTREKNAQTRRPDHEGWAGAEIFLDRCGAESQLCLVSQRESKWIKWPSRQIFRLYFHLPLRKSLAACSDLRKRDISEHMDAFASAILNVNCCQDWVCGWQQPLANCDTERENRKRKTVSGCWRNILNL